MRAIVLDKSGGLDSLVYKEILDPEPKAGYVVGDSDKLPDSGPGSYRFVEHRRYFDALLEGVREMSRSLVSCSCKLTQGDH